MDLLFGIVALYASYEYIRISYRSVLHGLFGMSLLFLTVTLNKYQETTVDTYEVTQIGDIVFPYPTKIKETVYHYPFSVRPDRIVYITDNKEL